MRIMLLAPVLLAFFAPVLFAEERVDRTVDGKEFTYRMGTWVDREYDPATMSDDVQKIRWFSGEYLRLMDRHPGILPYLALGARLLLVYKGEIISITPGH